MKNRSRIAMLLTGAARLDECGKNKLAEQMREAAKELASKRAQGRDWTEEDVKRKERHGTLFTMLTPNAATDRLKEAMLQRAYDLLWDGDAEGCDAIAEFLPTREVEAMLDAWSDDQDGKQPRSPWYENH